MNAVERNEIIPHPAYSPDWATGDYFFALFPNIKRYPLTLFPVLSRINRP